MFGTILLSCLGDGVNFFWGDVEADFFASDVATVDSADGAAKLVAVGDEADDIVATMSEAVGEFSDVLVVHCLGKLVLSHRVQVLLVVLNHVVGEGDGLVVFKLDFGEERVFVHLDRGEEGSAVDAALEETLRLVEWGECLEFLVFRLEIFRRKDAEYGVAVLELVDFAYFHIACDE